MTLSLSFVSSYVSGIGILPPGKLTKFFEGSIGSLSLCLYLLYSSILALISFNCDPTPFKFAKMRYVYLRTLKIIQNLYKLTRSSNIR